LNNCHAFKKSANSERQNKPISPLKSRLICKKSPPKYLHILWRKLIQTILF